MVVFTRPAAAISGILLACASLVALSACASTTSTTSTTSTSSAARPADTPADAASASATAAASSAAATSTCDPTSTIVGQTEGPYYTPGAPARTTISESDTVGLPLTLSGTVFDASCRPLPGATLDFWQADGNGTYDNEGFRLRGIQTTDSDGRYALTTVVPGLYPGRTEHIHVKITPPGGMTLTTQLYFPDTPQNDEDGIFSPTMLVTVDGQTADQMATSFDFVLPPS